MIEADRTDDLRDRVLQAVEKNAALAVIGSGSKAFLGPTTSGAKLDVSSHRGVVHYAPEELVLTVRGGTRLHEIEMLLAEHRQMLAFEPPHFGSEATIGGACAAGLSGPRRVAVGSVRDFVLGMRFINGRGEVLRVGGEVIKNVAGYDLSRLMVGAFGTLGVILDVSLKVLPQPQAEATLVFECDTQTAALKQLGAWALKPWPISATCHNAERLHLRLSGAAAAVQQAAARLGGEAVSDGAALWRDLREQQCRFFDDASPLWRISVPPATPPLDATLAAPQDRLMEWSGGLRWLKTTASPEALFDAARNVGGHATLFRNGDTASERFQPLPAPLLAIHQRVKQALDPQGLFNPGRIYRTL